jgi:hypothetical protein
MVERAPPSYEIGQKKDRAEDQAENGFNGRG